MKFSLREELAAGTEAALATTPNIGLPVARGDRVEGEAELVQELKARSIEAWAKVYDAYHGKLYRYALARLGSRDLAEDVAATVFQRALSAIAVYSYRGKPLLAWLYSIARNVISEHQRATLRSKVLSCFKSLAPGSDGGLTLSLLEKGRDQPRGAGRSDPEAVIGRLDLHAALAKLTSSQREVLLLRYFAGLPTREIAGIMGRQERAVYYLQARALESLRRHLS
jgi:RNA polymerase sigma-70 factor (ECF subfamily)